MSSNNNCISKLTTYEEILGKNVLIYVYAKSDNLVKNQLENLNFFCKHYNLNCIGTYIDSSGSNNFENKTNLKKLINENSNINVLIYGTNKLSRDMFGLFEIQKLSNLKNINYYDFKSHQFVFDKYFLELHQIANKIMERSDEKLQRKLDVLYIEPNKLPVKKTINNTLEDKQKLVNGRIEYTYLQNCDDVAIVCNEESKILGLPFNRDIGHDIIAGNFFIVGDDPELGEDRSLTQDQIDKYTKYFGKESIEKTNKTINEILVNSLNDYDM